MFLTESNEKVHQYTEHTTKRRERFFCVKHPQSSDFLDIMGEQGAFSFNRLILLYFEAAMQIWRFSGDHISSLKSDDISLSYLEEKAKDFHINKYDGNIKNAECRLVKYDFVEERILEKYGNTINNDVIETAFAMNFNKLMSNFGINEFEVEQKKICNTSDFDQLIMKMINNEEFGMLMLQWISLNEYTSLNFSTGIYKILEYITNDLEKNRNKFNENTEYYKCLIKLLGIVNKSKKHKNLFLGLMNDPSSLGFISRHGSQGDQKALKIPNHIKKSKKSILHLI